MAPQTDRGCPLSVRRAARKSDRKHSASGIADAILDGPKKFEDRGLLTWHDNIEVCKPGTNPDTGTSSHIHGTEPGNEDSEGRDGDFGEYGKNLAHRQKVNKLLESMEVVVSRGSTIYGRGCVSGRPKCTKNFRQKRMRLGETLWALYSELLPHLHDLVGSFLEYLAGD